MSSIIQRRGPMPNVQRWQSTYVRYAGHQEGQVTANGWELNASQRVQEEMQISCPPFGNSAATAGAPIAVRMKIISAPAEFAVPVKQDRRLTPDFKLRLEVRYRGVICYPLTVRAHMISQQEKDSLPEWRPEGMINFDVSIGTKPTTTNSSSSFPQLINQRSSNSFGFVERKPPTELKGTTYITHHFEANQDGENPPQTRPLSEQGTRFSTVMSSSFSNVNFGANGGAPLGPNQSMVGAGRDFLTSTSTNQDSAAATLNGLSQDSSSYLNPHNMTPQYFTDDSGFSFTDFNDISNFSTMIQDILETTGDSFMNPVSSSGFDNTSNSRTPTTVKTERSTGFTTTTDAKTSTQDGASNGESEDIIIQDFEFSNLEFVKPTRMSKVYICFACAILDYDLLYCVYHIPTVGICRAEQRAKACEKLTIPISFLEFTNSEIHNEENNQSEASVHSRVTRVTKRHPNEAYIGGRRLPQTPTSGLMVPDFEHSETNGVHESVMYTRQSVRDWIIESYDNTGLKRKLTELDLQTLECQAGFPVHGEEVFSIHLNQWTEFKNQFTEVLKLLKKIGGLWDREDPCVISGMHLDRQGTVQALSGQPPGTFLCRLSWSMPGSLVLCCKVQPTVTKADSDGLVHVAIRIDDLQMRKLDTWIRDFPAALHVLDIYTQKRVDKRKVFHSNYHRMKHLEHVDF
eukprot:g7682.t1